MSTTCTIFSKLLLEGLAVLVDDPRAHPDPTIEQLKQWNLEKRASIKNQAAFADNKGSSSSGRAMSEEAIQKRRAREEKRLAQAISTSNGPNLPLDSTVSTETTTGPRTQLQEIPVEKSASILHTVVIPAPSSLLEWYNPDACTYTTIAAARAAGVWDYPSTLRERARCGVFRNLWEQGYFMGGGIKFGGDYLVYPGQFIHLESSLFSNLLICIGDPLRYHSHFAASVLESPTTSLRPMEIVAHGRLGTATKKAHLLCGWDDEKMEVSYLSIEWAGFG